MTSPQPDDLLPPEPTTTQADLHQYLLKYFIKHPAVFGGADILNLHFATPQARAAIYLDILSRIRHDDGRIAVEAFVVVVPYGHDVAEYANTPSLLLAGPRHVSDKPLFTLADDPRFRGRLHLVPATDCRHEGVLSILRTQSVRTAAIVAEAAIYRNDSVSPFRVSGSSPRLEDFWVPQLHTLATESVNMAKCNEMYVVLDTGRFSPTRTALADLLLTIDNCGVFGSDNEQGLDYILASRSDRWENWLRDGRLGRAMRDIDELPSISDRNRLLLRAQLFHRVGLYRHILSDVRELTESIQEFDAPARLKVARMALDASASDTARRALDSALDHLADLEHLESALNIALELGSEQLQSKCVRRLMDRFPHSREIRNFQRRELLANRDFRGLARFDSNDAKSSDVYATAADHLSTESTPNYTALIADAKQQHRDPLRELCVRPSLPT